VSLRTDIHRAYDRVTPSTFGLPERVVQTALRESPSRSRADQFVFGLRAPLSLVAMFVLIAMVVGVFLAGRIVHDWSGFKNRVPAADTYHSELAQLEGRALLLPVLNAGDQCPETPLNALPGGLFPSGMYGHGPVFVAGGSSMSDAWGTYWYLAAVTTEPVTRLVVIRARDLQTRQSVIFVGNWAAGSVVGSDVVNGMVAQQHVELVLDRRHPPLNTIQAGTVTWGFTAGLAKGASGCIGWQIDTTGSPTEVLVTRSKPD